MRMSAPKPCGTATPWSAGAPDSLFLVTHAAPATHPLRARAVASRGGIGGSAFRFRAWKRFALGLFASSFVATAWGAAATPAKAAPAATEPATPGSPPPASADAKASASYFRQSILPILESRCYDCHGNGIAKGELSLEDLAEQLAEDPMAPGHEGKWWQVLRMVRAGIMPPADEAQPTAEEKDKLAHWVKYGPLRNDSIDPAPGRVVARRLNRVEYRNTIRDLMGVDFDTTAEFPPDDTVHGFDNNADALTISPMLMDKYIKAAETIANRAVPKSPTESREVASLGPVLFTTGSHENLRLYTAPTATGQGSKQEEIAASYRRFFPRTPPASVEERRAYAREILENFTARAYRRPVDPATIDRLVQMAETAYGQPGGRFEDGIARAATAVLASPRFLYRAEGDGIAQPGKSYALVDDYALASRLSYFLWSSMPDDTLLELAKKGELRQNLSAQVKRMVEDARAEQFVGNFAGQWLQARDVMTIPIDANVALGIAPNFGGRGAGAGAGVAPGTPAPRRVQFNADLRRAMRSETELLFNKIMREDRSVAEFIDSRYTFLNQALAEHYGIEGVEGTEMRLVNLPDDSPRGGVLTQGTVLVVSSNPTGTSPVKRGLFILENILGTPPPPAPPDIAPLDAARRSVTDRVPTSREVLEIHRSNAACASCHARMDPLGFAFENFSAVGTWRDREPLPPARGRGGRGGPGAAGANAGGRGRGAAPAQAAGAEPAAIAAATPPAPPPPAEGPLIVATGTLVTGESFDGVRELKKILITKYRGEFYHCLAEKMLTYALGRTVDHHDVETVDRIVADMEKHDGRFSALLQGVINSTPFQRQPLPDREISPSPADAAPARTVLR